ncbi:ComF family protein [Flavobacterium sp.]|uniref:ComF family protein n=1 Tax=Flavobacterium sp. TaxID=239 RepID=UPI003C420FC6
MLQPIINLFFPAVCAGCKALLFANESIICTQCRHEIPLTNHHLTAENEAFKKFYGRIAVEHASALFYFHKKGIVQELIHNLKYRGHEEIGTLIGHWYVEDLKKFPYSKQHKLLFLFRYILKNFEKEVLTK